MYETSTGWSSWPWSSASRAGWSQGRACWRSASGGLQRPRRPAARSHTHQTLSVFNSWLQRSPEAQGLFPVRWGRRLSRVCQGWAGRPIAWGSSQPKELAEHPQAIDQWMGAATTRRMVTRPPQHVRDLLLLSTEQHSAAGLDWCVSDRCGACGQAHGEHLDQRLPGHPPHQEVPLRPWSRAPLISLLSHCRPACCQEPAPIKRGPSRPHGSFG